MPAAHVEGLYSCLDYYQAVERSVQHGSCSTDTTTLYPGDAKFTAGSACTGMYRGLKLWEAAVREAGSLDQEAVIAALDHARIAAGTGGPAEMVPGQHHVRMNMYIAQAATVSFEVVEEPRDDRSQGSDVDAGLIVPAAASVLQGHVAHA